MAERTESHPTSGRLPLLALAARSLTPPSTAPTSPTFPSSSSFVPDAIQRGMYLRRATRTKRANVSNMSGIFYPDVVTVSIAPEVATSPVTLAARKKIEKTENGDEDVGVVPPTPPPSPDNHNFQNDEDATTKNAVGIERNTKRRGRKKNLIDDDDDDDYESDVDEVVDDIKDNDYKPDVASESEEGSVSNSFENFSEPSVSNSVSLPDPPPRSVRPSKSISSQSISQSPSYSSSSSDSKSSRFSPVKRRIPRTRSRKNKKKLRTSSSLYSNSARDNKQTTEPLRKIIPQRGDRVAIDWGASNIGPVFCGTVKRKVGKKAWHFRVEYDDGESRVEDLNDRRWRFDSDSKKEKENEEWFEPGELAELVRDRADIEFNVKKKRPMGFLDATSRKRNKD